MSSYSEIKGRNDGKAGKNVIFQNRKIEVREYFLTERVHDYQLKLLWNNFWDPAFQCQERRKI